MTDAFSIDDAGEILVANLFGINRPNCNLDTLKRVLSVYTENPCVYEEPELLPDDFMLDDATETEDV